MIKIAQKPSFMTAYFRGHKRAFSEGLTMPWNHPVKSLMSIVTLAMCFYIPLVLWTLWLNYQTLQTSWQNQGSVAIFITANDDESSTTRLLQEIQQSPVVANAKLQASKDVQEQLANDQQLTQILDILSSQDLPQQISVNISNQTSTEALDQWINAIQQHPMVEYVSYDRQWLDQIQALTQTLLRVAQVSAAVFMIIIMVILANLITNEISHHKNELRLLELVGASWAQVRRSFLYMGILFGIYASILAIVMITISFWWLSDTFMLIIDYFGMDIQLKGLSAYQMATVVIIALLVTWLGTRLSLTKTVLHQISDPNL